MFTDIVDSTAQSAELGDHGWGKLQDAHDAVVRAQLARFHGREIRKIMPRIVRDPDGLRVIFPDDPRYEHAANHLDP